jgi:4,5-DOPA dioxygenase extradiol
VVTSAPLYASDVLFAEAEPKSRAQRLWTPEDGPLPAIFLSHGAPPLLDDLDWMRQFSNWALDLPKPKSVLMVSAHWENAPLSLSSTAAATPLVYDFGGLDQRFYEMTYPSPDASELGRQVAAMMPDATTLHEHRDRGLDHGAWIPMKVMYPLADVPVVQLSLPTQDPGALYELGRRLRPLREQGVLVIGSGFMTHGLPYLRRSDFAPGSTPQGWSSDFDEWAREALEHGDVDTLAAFRDRAPGMPYAHPTVEHYIPLFVTLGLADQAEAPVTTRIDGFAFGLAKRSFEVG